MAVTICEFHGVQVSSFTSPNFAELIMKGREESAKDVFFIKLITFDEVGVYPICKDFVDENKIPQDLDLSQDEGLSDIVFDKLKPVCSRCLKVLLRAFGGIGGQPSG